MVIQKEDKGLEKSIGLGLSKFFFGFTPFVI